jgi:hypothetical protein
MPRPDVEAGSDPLVGNDANAPLLNGVGDAEPAGAAELVSHKQLAGQFSWLGWAAFGGPSAHVSLFQKVPRPRRSRQSVTCRVLGCSLTIRAAASDTIAQPGRRA